MQRTLVLGALWTASAAAAVGLGFLAVSLVGASASPTPVASTTTPAAASPASTSAAALPSGQMDTVGGTVYASCADGVPSLASAPAPGWWVDDSSEPGKVEFRNGSQKVEIRAVCVDGGPQFSVEGPGADGGSPGATPPAAPSTADDSSGGHGSDDAPADDSSGRGGGGHGSDG